MTRVSRLAAGLAVLAGLAVGDLGAASPKAVRKLVPGARVPKTRATLTPARQRIPNVVGTLLYDNNVPFSRDGATDPVIGNLFGPGVLDPHSVQAVSFRMAQNYSGDAVMSIWDPDGMGGATRLRQQDITGLPSNTVTAFTAMANLATPIIGHTGSFIAGMHNTFFTGLGCPGNTMLNGTCDGVALTMGSAPAPPVPSRAIRVPLMGGVFVPPTTMVASGVAAIPAVNAIFRVTGDNLPVELMNFDVK
jgi:hypothetical protein